MKITIYSSEGDNPLWTIVKSEMTQKEAENEGKQLRQFYLEFI